MTTADYVLYLPATAERFDRQVSGSVLRASGRIATHNVVAIAPFGGNFERVPVEHLLRITCLKPLG